jgi:hypothetical protein
MKHAVEEGCYAELRISRLSRPVVVSRFLRALFQFSKRTAGEAAKFGRSGVEFLGMVGTTRLERSEPAAEASELIRRQPGNSFGNFFDSHVAQYSTARTWLSDGKGCAGVYRYQTLIQVMTEDGFVGAR